MEVFAQFIVTLAQEMWPWEKIEPWESGLRTTFGRWPRVLKPGIRWSLPFVHTILSEPITEQITVCEVQSLSLTGGASYLVTLQLRYRVVDMLALQMLVHDYEDTLTNLAQGEAAHYMATCGSSALTAEALADAVLGEIEEVAAMWGLELFEVTCQDFATHKVMRWMQ